MGGIKLLPPLYKEGFGIKLPSKVNMSLNKETNPILLNYWITYIFLFACPSPSTPNSHLLSLSLSVCLCLSVFLSLPSVCLSLYIYTHTHTHTHIYIYIYIYIYEYTWCGEENKSFFKHFFATEIVRPLTSHLTNHLSKMSKTCWVLLEK